MVRKLTTTVLGVWLIASSWGIPVSTAAEYLAAAKAINPDRVITATSDITFTAGDIPIPDGVTFDLNGHTITLPDMLLDPTIRRGFALGDGSTLANGKIRNGGWVAYRFGGAVNPIEMRDIEATNIQGLIKIGAGNSAITEKVTIKRCRAVTAGVPGTIIDLGPGPCRDVVIDDVQTLCVYDPLATNTGSDGIGIELAMGSVRINNVVVDGCLGDGIDVKGNAWISNSVVRGASRQGFKLWGRMGRVSILDNCIASNNGYGSMINAGTVTVSNCYLEGGWRDNYAVMFGGGKEFIPGQTDHWGNPSDYGCGGVTATVTDSQFIQRRGVSRLIEAEKDIPALNVKAAQVTFDRCVFWNPPHPHVFIGKWYQSVENAKKGVWDPHIKNSTYADYPAPVKPGIPPVVVPPIVEPPVIVPPVDPPIVEPPVDDPLTDLAAVVAELKAWRLTTDARMNELRYRQDRDDNTFLMLLKALQNREGPVQ